MQTLRCENKYKDIANYQLPTCDIVAYFTEFCKRYNNHDLKGKQLRWRRMRQGIAKYERLLTAYRFYIKNKIRKFDSFTLPKNNLETFSNRHTMWLVYGDDEAIESIMQQWLSTEHKYFIIKMRKIKLKFKQQLDKSFQRNVSKVWNMKFRAWPYCYLHNCNEIALSETRNELMKTVKVENAF